MKKYRVYFSGFAYVMASDEGEAEEKFFDDDEIYRDTTVNSVEEVEECTVEV